MSASVCEPGCCWTLVLLDTRQSAVWPPLTHLWDHLYSWVLVSIFLPPSPCLQLPLPELVLCMLRDFFFFSNLCILITTSSISKGWMFWDNIIFPQVTLLFLPMDSCIKRKLLISRRKLSWFLYSLNLSSLKPLANLLFIFQGYKTKPNAIRQRSAHILNREQGLGSLVKSFIRATLKFLTK